MLPCTTPLERPDLPFVFPLTLGLQVQPYLQATEAVLPPKGESRDEATIYTDIAKAANAPLFGSRIFQWLMQLGQRRRGVDRYRSVPQRGLLNLILRLCRQPGFRNLLGSGWLRPAHEAGSFLGQRVYTDSKRVELAPAELVQALHALKSSTKPLPAEYSYQLISKRQVETHNSWTHNLTDFLDRLEQQNFLYMHPADAKFEGFELNSRVAVSSASGEIHLPVRFTSDLARGVVAIPHGWGHQDSGQNIASTSPGVNVNLLAASGVEAIDPLSGMSHLTGIPVALATSTASTTDSPTDWSGIHKSAHN